MNVTQLCRSCTSADGIYPEMACSDSKAHRINYRCPNVWSCDCYRREPGSDDYLGERTERWAA